MFSDLVVFVRNLFTSLPFNIFDYIVFAAFLLYIYEDVSFGIVASAISLVATISSFFIAITAYSFSSRFLVMHLSLTKGISDAASFLLVALLSFILVSYLLSLFTRKYVSNRLPVIFDRIGGVVFGSISFFFIAAFIVSFLLAFPTSGAVKDAIRGSVSGRFLSVRTQGIDREVRQIFGGAIVETINFLTVEPESNQCIPLHFTSSSPKVDQASTQQMLSILNANRASANLPELTLDSDLTRLAQLHAKDMLARGYFCHYTPEGLSPFDRMAKYGIVYQEAGENLAFAPDATIAMDGLMKSPGHKANILSKSFHKIGIGVLDAGIYGKMFVQEFTD